MPNKPRENGITLPPHVLSTSSIWDLTDPQSAFRFSIEDVGFEARQSDDIDLQPAPEDGTCASCFNPRIRMGVRHRAGGSVVWTPALLIGVRIEFDYGQRSGLRDG